MLSPRRFAGCRAGTGGLWGSRRASSGADRRDPLRVDRERHPQAERPRVCSRDRRTGIDIVAFDAGSRTGARGDSAGKSVVVVPNLTDLPRPVRFRAEFTRVGCGNQQGFHRYFLVSGLVWTFLSVLMAWLHPPTGCCDEERLRPGERRSR